MHQMHYDVKKNPLCLLCKVEHVKSFLLSLLQHEKENPKNPQQEFTTINLFSIVPCSICRL